MLILHLTHTFATWCKTCKTNMHTHFQCKKSYRFGEGEEEMHAYVHLSIVNDMYNSMNATFGQNLAHSLIEALNETMNTQATIRSIVALTCPNILKSMNLNSHNWSVQNIIIPL